MLFLLSKYMFHLWNVGRKKVNTCTKLWLASRASHKIGLAGLRPLVSLTPGFSLWVIWHGMAHKRSYFQGFTDFLKLRHTRPHAAIC